MSQKRIVQNRSPYFVTTNTHESYPFFDDDRFAEILSGNIFLYAKEYKFTLYGYCIMPDHIHMLLKTHLDFNISKVMKAIKSKTYHDLHEEGIYKDKLWQRSFYDKIIYNEAGIFKALNYIKNNPISADLEGRYLKPPYMYVA